MPTEHSQQQLDWTEANLSKVLTEIYKEAGKDPEFYDRLMAEPYKVLSQRIKVPEDYNEKVYARQKNKKMFIMNVPSYSGTAKAEASETPVADYQILCTTAPW